VDIGWLCGDVILYMAFVAIANFAQQNNELGYAFKFMRVMILALVAIFKLWGFVIGIALFLFFVASNKTLSGRRYLYPLIPFNKRAMKRLLVREKKSDFEKEEKRGT
jgi:stage V sporulation protein AF